MKRAVKFSILMLLIPVLIYSQDMKVTPDTKVTINTGTTLKIINGGNLLLQDDLNSSPSFLQKGTVVFSGGGEAKVEQYLPKDAWHIVASPVSNGTINSYLWMYLYRYVEATEAWQYLNQPLNTPLVPGEGYFVWPYSSDPNGTNPASPDSAVLNGTLNFQTINDYALSYTSTASNPGWNIAGNPFPCAIDWNGSPDWDRVNVDATVYVYDNGAGGGTSGNYRLYNYVTGIGIPSGNDGIIAATQGFWVHATGAGAKIDIPESQRLHSNKSFYKNSGDERNNLLRLKVYQTNTAQFYETVIAFDKDATGGFDAMYDGAFLKGRDNAPEFFTMTENEKYSVNFLPDYNEYREIPLYFYSAGNGECSVTASNLESFPGDLPVYLEDKKEQVFHNLKEAPEYTFFWEYADEPGRFVVHFGEPLGKKETGTVNRIHIYAYDKSVYVRIPFELKGEIKIYDLPGRVIKTAPVKQGLNKIDVHLNNTYLVTRLISGKTLISKKVFIK